MYVRLGFSVAISIDPDILILDESLAVGDIEFQQKCLQKLQILQERGATIVLVTHDVPMIRNYCSSAIYLKGGEILFHGYPEKATEIYLKDIFEDRQRSWDGKGGVLFKPSASGDLAFGTGHGEIIDASLWRRDEQTSVFCQREVLKLKVAAWVDDSFMNPEIVLQLRDFRGYALYGIDSNSRVFISRKAKETGV